MDLEAVAPIKPSNSRRALHLLLVVTLIGLLVAALGIALGRFGNEQPGNAGDGNSLADPANLSLPSGDDATDRENATGPANLSSSSEGDATDRGNASDSGNATGSGDTTHRGDATDSGNATESGDTANGGTAGDGGAVTGISSGAATGNSSGDVINPDEYGNSSDGNLTDTENGNLIDTANGNLADNFADNANANPTESAEFPEQAIPNATENATTPEQEAAIQDLAEYNLALAEAKRILGPNQLAYASDKKFVVINLASAETPIKIITPIEADMHDLLAAFGTRTIFQDKKRTHGFALGNTPEDLIIYNLTSRGEVVLSKEGRIAMASTSAFPQEIYHGNASGVFVRILPVPAGSKLLAVPFLGMLVTIANGKTFIVSQEGLTSFSDWPVIAATSNFHIEIRCWEPLFCAPVWVDHATQEAFRLPQELASRSSELSISPVGSHILQVNNANETSQADNPNDTLQTNNASSALQTNNTNDTPQDNNASNAPQDENANHNPQADQLYSIADRQFIDLPMKAGEEVAWSSDGKLLAWFQAESQEPRLVVFDVDDEQIATLNLAKLSAPKRDNNSLILLP